MNPDKLLLRQRRLLTRSAQLRLALAEQTQVFKKPLAVADQARKFLSWLGANPAWPLSAVLVLVVIRPQRTLAWGGRLWWAYRAYQHAHRWITNQP